MKKPLGISLLISLFAMLFLSGCSLFQGRAPDIPVSYFDIGSPKKVTGLDQSIKINVQDAKTTDPYNERMVFRVSETYLRIDDFNRWAATPSEMIRKYFILAFNQPDTNKVANAGREAQYDLFITVMCIEEDLNTKEARLALLLVLRSSDGSLIYQELMKESTTVGSTDAESFAIGIKKITDSMLFKLASNISQIKQAQKK